MEILIVDDEPQVAEVLARSLSRQGHRTTVAHSGPEALDRLGRQALDAMFLDVSMPGMNGLDVMAEVKRRQPALAVVVITGHATADEVDRIKALGAVDVIQKPSALTNYHRALQRLGGTKQYPDADRL
jgi:CheY-like chemotaxis protein